MQIKYPWDEWFSQLPKKIYWNYDYMSFDFSQKIRNAAKRRGLDVTVKSIQEDGVNGFLIKYK